MRLGIGVGRYWEVADSQKWLSYLGRGKLGGCCGRLIRIEGAYPWPSLPDPSNLSDLSLQCCSLLLLSRRNHLRLTPRFRMKRFVRRISWSRDTMSLPLGFWTNTDSTWQLRNPALTLRPPSC